jgi:hypothetical protein
MPRKPRPVELESGSIPANDGQPPRAEWIVADPRMPKVAEPFSRQSNEILTMRIKHCEIWMLSDATHSCRAGASLVYKLSCLKSNYSWSMRIKCFKSA